jgi:hypothetical protein
MPEHHVHDALEQSLHFRMGIGLQGGIKQTREAPVA